MNGDQTSAFLSASGVNASDLNVLLAAITVALVIIWAAWVIRDMGFQTLYGKMRAGTWTFYTVRAMLIVLVLIVLATK